ncbi:MAG TPA: (2Fe-2S)-binding protein [Pseudonocardiaceae bacterium]
MPSSRTHGVARTGLDPLAESLGRLDGVQSWLHLRRDLPAIAGERTWWRCSTVLTQPAHFEKWGAELASWLQATYDEAPERVVAGYLLTWYLSVPGLLAGLLFHRERRVPELRPEALAFRLGDPRPHPDGVAVLDGRFACLPDDPEAGSAAATVVADEPALAALLRARFTGHAAQFVAAFQPAVRFGRRTLWAAATDALDEGLWLAGRYCAAEAEGVADAALVLPTELTPFTSASTLVAAGENGGWTRRRESCCFHYALRNGQGECETCPRMCGR